LNQAIAPISLMIMCSRSSTSSYLDKTIDT
jgi:hypothetical protein